MSQIKHRRFLREKEAAQILGDFAQKMKIDIKQLFDMRNLGLEVGEIPNARVYFVKGKPLIANFKDILIPTLLFDKALQLLPRITVNMGAVPHICNGADLMAPGIVKIEGDFKPDDYVLVTDERHQKPLAVVIALTDSQTARSSERGKVAKNMHYVGDGLWNQLRKE